MTRALQIILLGLSVVALMYFSKPVVVPFMFGWVVALISYPFCKKLERRLPRAMAITISLLAVLGVFAFVGLLLVWEAEILYKQAPLIIEKLNTALTDLQNRIETQTGMDADMQIAWLKETISGMLGGLAGLVNATFSAAFSILFNVFMIPIFAALLLYNREQYVAALTHMVQGQTRERLPQILSRAITTFFHYILGMAKVYLIVGVLNSLGLMLLGVKHAWLFGMITAIMTMIPYIGIVISAMLPISIAWITFDSGWYALAVVAVFAVVQYLEANIIFPKVVGQQLNLNTLAALLGILLGGLIWGVAGMVLILPILAILRIVSEEVEGMESVRLLLGDKR
jgi:predicted PurR-regulated permease PerM